MLKIKNKSRFLLIAGISELILGLILSLIVGIQVSWPSALVLAFGFFFSANMIFFFALKKA
jgi:hypothetical protein